MIQDGRKFTKVRCNHILALLKFARFIVHGKKKKYICIWLQSAFLLLLVQSEEISDVILVLSPQHIFYSRIAFGIQKMSKNSKILFTVLRSAQSDVFKYLHLSNVVPTVQNSSAAKLLTKAPINSSVRDPEFCWDLTLKSCSKIDRNDKSARKILFFSFTNNYCHSTLDVPLCACHCTCTIKLWSFWVILEWMKLCYLAGCDKYL